MKERVVVRLKGGLGNQLFQYAAGRAIAQRSRMRLALDIDSGFAVDKVYRRTYLLDSFPIQALRSSCMQRLHFMLDRILRKLHPRLDHPVRRYPWGNVLYETDFRYLGEVGSFRPTTRTWMEGYWQTERYFCDIVEAIQEEVDPPKPTDHSFVSMAERIESSNAVALGVRRFEEIPGRSRKSVGGVVPYDFYEKAAAMVNGMVSDPVFYVFCTKLEQVVGMINLPGTVVYVTPENGFADSVQTLYLLSRCQHHIISNSSLYWWGAWLSEQRYHEQVIVAANAFTNRDCIPDRWLSVSVSPEYWSDPNYGPQGS